jgi:hypothetical protein
MPIFKEIVREIRWFFGIPWVIHICLIRLMIKILACRTMAPYGHRKA